MDVLITYDIKRNHTEIKDELKGVGYKDVIRGVRLSDNTQIDKKLPNTTLIKYGALSTQACQEQVKSIIGKNNGGLDCVFCVELAKGFDWNAL